MIAPDPDTRPTDPPPAPAPCHYGTVAILPTNPPRPCPELLTEDEAISYCRLDLIDIKDPAETLRRYRAEGKLRGTQVGKAVRYRRVELERFLELVTDQNPR